MFLEIPSKNEGFPKIYDALPFLVIEKTWFAIGQC
jgi:hypothetical protein